MCVEVILLTARMTAVPSFLRVRKLSEITTMKILIFFLISRRVWTFGGFILSF